MTNSLISTASDIGRELNAEAGVPVVAFGEVDTVSPPPESAVADPALAAVATIPCKFWMVWTKKGRIPRFVHLTQDSAVAEAERLALRRPGKTFIVLRAYMKKRIDAAVELTPIPEAEPAP